MEIFTLVLGIFSTNTYIIIDNGKAVVIDPAHNGKKIADFVASKNAEIESVLITHGHGDHIGAVQYLKSIGAKTYMTETDFKLINSTNVFFTSEKFDLDKSVNDGDVLELIGHRFTVLSTPGHTPGSVCYIMDDSTIFSGDTLFQLSVGRTDFYMGNFAELKKSLHKLFSLPHDYEVLPGHGNSTTLDYERKNNPYYAD